MSMIEVCGVVGRWVSNERSAGDVCVCVPTHQPWQLARVHPPCTIVSPEVQHPAAVLDLILARVPQDAAARRCHEQP